jgi:hypothetical protein
VKTLFNRQWVCTVKKLPEHLAVETHYLDTKREMSARMSVDPRTFEILNAALEVCRASPGAGSPPGTREIPELSGIPAYFEAGRELRKVNWADELEQSLFAENVRAVIQAETFLLPERGFASEEAYDGYWRDNYRNSCRYYSNLDRVKRTWTEHVAGQVRARTLYVRTHGYHLYSLADFPSGHSPGGPFGAPPAAFEPSPSGREDLLLTGTFSDSFHELGLTLLLNGEDFTVVSARAGMLRGPDAVCFEGMAEAASLKGKKFSPPPAKKEIAALLGGENGCVHLIDVAHNLAETLALGNNFNGREAAGRFPG